MPKREEAVERWRDGFASSSPLANERVASMFRAIETVEQIRDVAHECGYAIAVHGSLRRDLDLIAAPWTEGASSAEALLEALNDRLNIIYGPPNPKPHGRVGYVLHGFAGCKYVDLSIMPLRSQIERDLREALEAVQGDCYLWQVDDGPWKSPDELIEHLRKEARAVITHFNKTGEKDG